MKNFKVYKDRNKTIAIVVKKGFSGHGMVFFTPESFGQQLAYVSHGRGKVIAAHIHNEIRRDILRTQEILVMRKGEIKIRLYTRTKKFLKSLILSSGDVILFASGGHGYEVMRDAEIILVKQGPYAGERDKVYIK